MECGQMRDAERIAKERKASLAWTAGTSWLAKYIPGAGRVDEGECTAGYP